MRPQTNHAQFSRAPTRFARQQPLPPLRPHRWPRRRRAARFARAAWAWRHAGPCVPPGLDLAPRLTGISDAQSRHASRAARACASLDRHNPHATPAPFTAHHDLRHRVRHLLDVPRLLSGQVVQVRHDVRCRRVGLQGHDEELRQVDAAPPGGLRGPLPTVRVWPAASLERAAAAWRGGVARASCRPRRGVSCAEWQCVF